MQIIIKTAHHTWRWILRLCIFSLLTTALLLAILRLSLPLMADYRAELEQRISAYINVPVQIKQLRIAWWGWGPALQIDGFSLLDPNNAKDVRFGFNNALISLDMARSLWAGQLMLQHISLQGGQLILQWSAEHGLQLIPNQQTSQTLVTPQEVISWLFQTQTLDLRFDQVVIQGIDIPLPLLSGGELLLSIRGDERSRRLDATLDLPESLNQQLQVAAKLNRHPTSPEQWQAEFYLHGNALALSALAPFDLPISHAETDVELWGYWRKNALHKIIGQIQLDQLAFANQPMLNNADIQLEWRPDEGGWHLHSQLRADIPTISQRFDGLIDLYHRSQHDQSWLEGKTTPLPLPLLAALAASQLSQQQQEILQAIAPTGSVTELSFRLPDSSKPLQLNARFKDLQIQAWQQIPGISGLHGEIALTPDNGWLSLSTQDTNLNWSLLRESIEVQELAGMLEWQRHKQSWSLFSNDLKFANADLNVQAQGRVILTPDNSPVLDVRLDYSDIDVAKVRNYLPVAILKPKLLAWLDRAFISGRIPFGGAVFLGALQDFPFANKKGIFETRFLTENTVFDYRPGWPRIEGLNAEVIFHNQSVLVNAKTGKIFDVDLRDVQANIEQLNQSPLQIQGQLRGPGASMLRFVQESPLEKKVGRYLKDIQSTQNNDLDLTLTIPLKKSHGTKTKVSGILNFAGNRVTIAKHDVDLSNVNGKLTFTERDLNAAKLKVEFRGDPAQLSITTLQKGSDKGALQFNLRGQLGLNALLGKQAPLFEPYFAGRSDWNVQLTIPKQAAKTDPRFSIDFQSALDGMSVKLPKPLAKTTKVKRSLKGHAEIGTDMHLTLDYAPDAQALIQLTRDNGKFSFNRGELRIDSGTPELPNEPGLKTLARLDEFDLAAFGAGEPLPEWFKTLQAQIGELAIGQQRLQNTTVSLTNSKNGLNLQLQGKDVAGRIVVPAAVNKSHPIQAQLRHMVLSLNDAKETDKTVADTTSADALPIDPRQLPPLQLIVDDLQLDGRSLGHLALLVTPDQRGLNLEQLELQSDQHRFSAKGDWRVLQSGQQRSRLEAHLYSPGLGETLAKLGYAGIDLKGAETFADLAAAWPGPLVDFSAEKMQGRLTLQISKGQFVELDPGLGRVVGLFNIGTLTRRLQLDFSDLFESGLAFDSIGGHISFDPGEAYTDDLLLQGPSANILFKGSLDLVNQTFKQTVTVMPQLSSSLAIAGALTGGPAVGAAVFLAGQILKSGLDKVVAYQYSLTGSWKDPKVEIIKQPESLQESGFGQR